MLARCKYRTWSVRCKKASFIRFGEKQSDALDKIITRPGKTEYSRMEPCYPVPFVGCFACDEQCNALVMLLALFVLIFTFMIKTK